MPKLYRKNAGGYYTKVPIERKIATFQIDEEGVKILRTLGYKDGENFDIEDYWRLHRSGHTYTLDHDLADTETYGGRTLNVKPEGPPDILDPNYGPGWIHDRVGEKIDILFKEGKKFVIKRFVKDTYLKFLAGQKDVDLPLSNEWLTDEVSKVLKSRIQAQRAIDCILTSMVEALRSHEPVNIESFGSFRVIVANKKREVSEKKKWKIWFRAFKELQAILSADSDR